jgi:hypothetical protein
MKKAPTLFLAVAFALTLALGATGCERQDGGNPAVKPAVLTAPLPRDKFLELVRGQRDAQVLARVGRPDATNDYAGSMGVNWIYLKKSADPATGKVDEVATLVFQNGVVTQVVFK